MRPSFPTRMAALTAPPRLALLAISATILAGCSGGSSATSPTAPTPPVPTPPAPTVTSLTVSGTNSVDVGSTTEMTATARRSDGSTEVVSSTADWQSSNTAVATVSSDGRVTAVSPGSSMISAAFGGRSGQLPVEVTAGVHIERVTIAAEELTIRGTCDTDSLFESSEDGEFYFRFEVERSGGRTSIWGADEKFTLGKHPLTAATAFNRNITQGEDFILWFYATEYDGLLGADPKLPGGGRSRSYTYEDGVGWVASSNVLELGSSDCGASIRWTVSSRRQ